MYGIGVILTCPLAHTRHGAYYQRPDTFRGLLPTVLPPRAAPPEHTSGGTAPTGRADRGGSPNLTAQLGASDCALLELLSWAAKQMLGPHIRRTISTRRGVESQFE